MTWVVYVTVEPATGRYYVGKSSQRRINEGYKGSGLWPWHATRKGRKLQAEAIYATEDREDAYDAEVFFIQCCKEDDLCMNISDGGEGGHWERAGPAIRAFWADPEKAAAAREKQRAALAAWGATRRGIKMSEESREKMRISQTGRKHSEETKAKISAGQANRVLRQNPLRKCAQLQKRAEMLGGKPLQASLVKRR